MGDFQKVLKQTVKKVSEIPGADKIELIEFDNGYVTVAIKDTVRETDQHFVIPADSTIPPALAIQMGLDAKLGGRPFRVKAREIRGVLCDCIIFPNHIAGVNGISLVDVEDLGPSLGIGKFRSEPIEDRLCDSPNRASLRDSPTENHDRPRKRSDSGPLADTRGQESDRTRDFEKYTINYDIHNVRHHTSEFNENDPVHITEKVHGSWFQYGAVLGVGAFITSKGLAAKGVSFKLDAKNLWTDNLGTNDALSQLVMTLFTGALSLGFRFCSVLGEIYGKGVQDLHYGANEPAFIVFDLLVGHNSKDFIYIDPTYAEILCNQCMVPYVPVLYRGPYNELIAKTLAGGPSSLTGKPHIREGVVVRSMVGAKSPRLPGNRKILKVINPAYLARGKNELGEEPTESQ